MVGPGYNSTGLLQRKEIKLIVEHQLLIGGEKYSDLIAALEFPRHVRPMSDTP